MQEKSIFISDKFFTDRRLGKEMTRDKENGHFTEPILHVTPYHKPLHLTEPSHQMMLYTKQAMIITVVLTQTLALLSSLLIFGRMFLYLALKS